MELTDINILYKNLFPKFNSWIIQNSGTNEDAHDTFQEVLEMMLIKSNIGKLEVKTSLEAYVFRACKFRWIDHLRKIKRQGKVISLDETLLNSSTDFQYDMIELEEEQLKYKTLDETFLKLSDLCQKLLTLVKTGMKPKDIADRLDIAGASTVNRRKFACMESWKKHLASHKVTTLKSTKWSD